MIKAALAGSDIAARGIVFMAKGPAYVQHSAEGDAMCSVTNWQEGHKQGSRQEHLELKILKVLP